MKIVVLSDIHANSQALERVLADLPPYDEIYCLGDIVGYGPNPNEVTESLRKLNPTVVILGNHDHAVVTGDVAGFVDYAVEAIQWTRKKITPDNLKFLQTLRPSGERLVGEHPVALFHGSPRDPLNEYIFPGTPTALLRELLRLSGGRLLLLGHTHVPMYFRDGPSMLINPGSVGQPRDGDPRASYAIIDIEGGEVIHKFRRVQYDIDETAEAIAKNKLPGFLSERLYLGI